MTTTTTKPNLAAKLAEVMGAVSRIEKKGFNAFHKYQYVRESDLVDAVRPLLAERSIFLHQDVIHEEQRDTLTVVEVAFTWIDGETGESLPPQRFVGYGDDKSDKGIYKALTGCEKYFLMKTFLVPTGDDPEADEKADKRAAAKEAATGPVTIKPASRQGMKRGGQTESATDAQLTELGVVARKLGLNSATLAAAAGRILERDVPFDAPGLRAWLQSLSPDQIGRLINELSTVSEQPEEPEEPEPDVLFEDTEYR